VIESRKMRWAGHVPHTHTHWEMRNLYKILFGSLKRGEDLGEVGIHMIIILKWNLNYYDATV
jgi:hypothetical protein